MKGEVLLYKGPNRIIQNYSEKVLAVFDGNQIKTLYELAVTHTWPDHGPKFLNKNGRNSVVVEEWKCEEWVKIHLNDLPTPSISKTAPAGTNGTTSSSGSLALAARALHERR